MEEGVNCHISKSDMKSAFRNLGLRKRCWKYLVLKAKNPKDNQWYYFVDKCLPFGASISCALFWKYLVLKAKNPKDNQWYYFVDKCLPFGASISCALFQAFLDSVAYLVQWRLSSKKPVNYLNDFLFIALLRLMCQNQLNSFM